jgi:hypothetical protein
MSFEIYQKKNISTKLKLFSNSQPPEISNVTVSMTVGLNKLFSNIQTNQRLPLLIPNPRGLTNDEGHFETKGNVTLLKKYKITDSIGNGACSTVYLAEDVASQKLAALKSIRKNFEILCVREKLFLDHLKYLRVQNLNSPCKLFNLFIIS